MEGEEVWYAACSALGCFDGLECSEDLFISCVADMVMRYDYLWTDFLIQPIKTVVKH